MDRQVNRVNQIVLIGTFIGFSWLGMQAVHELGHVLGAITTGGKVTTVVLHPLTISRTDVHPNPHPLIEVWAGPIVGSVLPLVIFLTAKFFKSPGLYLFRFFAGFCLTANGVYIGAESGEGRIIYTPRVLGLQHRSESGDIRWNSVRWGEASG